MTAEGPAGDDPQVIKVRTELVVEQLVSRVLGRALELRSDQLSPEAEAVLDEAPEPRELARLGYTTRVAETEQFDPARRPIPWLAKRIDEGARSEGDRVTGIASLCTELASEEPDDRPDPGEGSWRIPGPGGHVRHFVALAAADELTHGEGNGEPVLHRELPVGEAKRCFLYGFYARCCEEAAG